MIIRREKRKLPLLNTTSTADISFMLLIFFLVTSSLRIRVLANNQVAVNDELTDISALKSKVETFVENAQNSAQLPEKHERTIALLGKCMVTDKHIIQVKAERTSSYDTYFSVQNEIVAAYQTLRNRLARQRFGRSYVECSEKEQEALREYYPQRISEEYVKEEGGAR